LVDRLRSYGECDWIEFKQSWFEPEKVGRYISALANGARIEARSKGYLVWGLANDGSLVGTMFDHATQKVGAQPFEFWLKGRVGPKGHGFRFLDLEIEGLKITILEIDAASSVPVRFDGIPHVRIGSATPRLEDHPDREKRLLQALVATSFENEWAAENVSAEDVHGLLDVEGALARLDQHLGERKHSLRGLRT
jgi:predicted HTH transcriptional regulator